MIYYRVTCGYKAEWFTDSDHAHSVASEWARSAILDRQTTTVTVDSYNISLRSVDRLLAALNGQNPARRHYLIGIDNGVITMEQKWKRKRQRIHMDPIKSYAHPTHIHADWIATVHANQEIEDLFRRAPDPRSCMFACSIAQVHTSANGYKLTAGVCRYCWDWVHSIKRK
jgi:hypothetical protein